MGWNHQLVIQVRIRGVGYLVLGPKSFPVLRFQQSDELARRDFGKALEALGCPGDVYERNTRDAKDLYNEWKTDNNKPPSTTATATRLSCPTTDLMILSILIRIFVNAFSIPRYSKHHCGRFPSYSATAVFAWKNMWHHIMSHKLWLDSGFHKLGGVKFKNA